ncbi:MAG: hypothetical protein HGB12_11880 [Bacteroidetes bacterium]|nr:hypothetical protein [Bacteroidota bacterium]
MLVRKKIILFLVIFCTGLCFFSCKHEDVPPLDVGYEYFPSNTGHWVLYQVDSTYYDDYTHQVKEYHFFMKEIIESTYLDNENRPTQRIERYKQIDTLPFILQDVWYSNLTSSTAEKVEENIRYVKLQFPINEGEIWNGNVFNNLDELNYKYENVYELYTVNGVTYNPTVTVIQKMVNYLTEESNMTEVYAKNIGLIYKKFKDVKKYPAPGLDSIIGGVDYTYKIISYGN